MKMLLIRLFPGLTPETVYVFLLGAFCGLVFLFALFLFCGILYLIFRNSRKVGGVTLQASHGSLFIAASAISDLIRSLGDNFPDLEISRIRLLADKKDLIVQVKVFYAAGGESMRTLADEFQLQALALLKNSFGIENIRRIDLIVPKGIHR